MLSIQVVYLFFITDKKAGQRGHSSVGRALALQARGRRFDPGWLHLLRASVKEVVNIVGCAFYWLVSVN